MSHLLPNEMRSDRTEDLKYSDVLPTEEKLKVVKTYALLGKYIPRVLVTDTLIYSEFVCPSRSDWQNYKETEPAQSFSHCSELEH